MKKNPNNEDKKISAANCNIPAVTVFSIDPATGQPYATTAYALSLADYHVSHFAKNLLVKLDHEDIKQELMLKLCLVSYDKTKSAPNTFMIMCFKSQCARIWEREFKVRDKHKETNDFVLMEEDGDAVLATEYIGIDHTTPEDYLAASQMVATSNGKPPQGWVGHRGTIWEGTRAPTKKSVKKARNKRK